MTWRAGVDVLCFGGTKNGMAVGEAILFFNRKLAEDFDYRCKQAGQLASKMRFLSAPWVGMLETGAWLRNAEHGNACARRLQEQIAGVPGLEIMFPVQANAVFVRMVDERMAALRDRGWRFYTFIGGGARFMFAWDAEPQRVDELAADLRQIASGEYDVSADESLAAHASRRARSARSSSMRLLCFNRQDLILRRPRRRPSRRMGRSTDL